MNEALQLLILTAAMWGCGWLIGYAVYRLRVWRGVR